MNSKELLEKLTSNELFPIRVEGSTEKEGSEGLQFIGDLDEFIKAAKALNSKAIFVTTKLLDESDFIYEVDENSYDADEEFNNEFDDDFDEEDDDDETEDEHSKEIYLPTVLPSISEYKHHMGEECIFKLSLRSEECVLDYYLSESWWNEFEKLREEAIDKIVEDEHKIMQKVEESRKKLEQERRAKEKELIGKLKKLLNDKDFVRLPTQLAMKSYALDKIPGLTELDSARLTIEIQELNGRIIAKGHRRR